MNDDESNDGSVDLLTAEDDDYLNALDGLDAPEEERSILSDDGDEGSSSSGGAGESKVEKEGKEEKLDGGEEQEEADPVETRIYGFLLPPEEIRYRRQLKTWDAVDEHNASRKRPGLVVSLVLHAGARVGFGGERMRLRERSNPPFYAYNLLPRVYLDIALNGSPLVSWLVGSDLILIRNLVYNPCLANPTHYFYSFLLLPAHLYCTPT